MQTSRNFDLLAKNPTSEYWKQQREKAEKIFDWFKEKWEGRTDYLSDAKSLREALDDYEKIQWWIRGTSAWDDFWIIWTESFYYRLQRNLHSDDKNVIAKSNSADEFATKQENKLLFFELAISQIPTNKQTEFLSNELLQPYHHFLEKQFNSARYLLSPESEKVINLLTKTAYENWDNMTSKFLSKAEKEVELTEWKKSVTLEELFTLCSNENPDVRQIAIKAINEIHSEAREFAENEMNSILEYKKTIDDLRWFKNADDFVSVRDDVSINTVHTMIECVINDYAFSRDFYKLKSKLLWVPALSYSEKTLKYWSNNKKCLFEESVNLVRKTLWCRDSEFLDIFNNALEKGHIDVYPWKWKRWWAFCTDSPKWQPAFILLNYTNELRDASTLIHETWHYVSDTLCKKYQNALNCGIMLSTAETHSIFFELLLADSLEEKMTDEELLSYRMANIDDMVACVHRQVAEYCFEQDLHKQFREKWYLSCDEIGELFLQHMKDYTWEWISYDEYDANRWISWHHNRSFFYVYSYASGYLAAQAMLKWLKSWKISIEQIKNFYSTWCSKSPESVFADMGIDITQKQFWNDALSQIREYLDDTIALAKKLWKIQ